LSRSISSLKVRFSETDQMGVAHHSSYVLWCEVGRVDWMHAHDMSYKHFEQETGVSLVVSELNIKYRSGVSFDDEVIIETRLTEAKSRRFTFTYELSSNATLVATAETIHTPMTRTGRATRMPQVWLESLAKHLGD